jgi:hypothetical protein
MMCAQLFNLFLILVLFAWTLVCTSYDEDYLLSVKRKNHMGLKKFRRDHLTVVVFA